MEFSHQTRDLECFAGICPPFFSPDGNNTDLRTGLSAIPFVSDLCGVDVAMIPGKISQALPNSKELSV